MDENINVSRKTDYFASRQHLRLQLPIKVAGIKDHSVACEKCCHCCKASPLLVLAIKIQI